MTDILPLEAEKLSSTIQERIDKAKRARQAHEIDWTLAIAFYVGRQYVKWHTLKGLVDAPRSNPYTVRLVVNLIANYVRTMVATMMEADPRFEVAPQTVEPEDVDAARVAQKVLSYVFESELRKKVMDFYLWLVITGNAFLFTHLNRDRGDEIAPGVRLGEVEIDVVSPYDVYLPTGIVSIDDADWCVIRTAIPIEVAKKRFGDDVKADSSSVSGGVDSYLRSIAYPETTTESDMVSLYHYFERPNPAREEGMYALVVNERVKEVIAPYPYMHGELPLAVARAFVIPGTFYGKSPVSLAIPLQKEYNRARSQMVEIRNLYARPTIFAPQGSIDQTVENDAGKIVFYRPVGGPPTVAPPPPVNQAQIADINLIKGELDTIFGIFEITAHGSVPANVRAASAMAMLREQDEKRLGLMSKEVSRAFERCGRQIIGLIRQFYAIPRVVAIVGRNKEYEALRFSAKDIRIPRDITVTLGTSLPASRTQRIQMVFDLYEMGIIQDRQKVLELLEFGNIEGLQDESRLDREEAERENTIFVEQPVEMVPQIATALFHEWQDHAIHFEVHNRFRKSIEFTKLSDEAREVFNTHVSQHELMMQSQQAQAQMQQMQQAGMTQEI